MRTSTVAVCLLLLLGGAAAVAQAPAPAPETESSGLVGGYESIDYSDESDADKALALVEAEVAKDYPNDDIELISVERQIVSGTNWHIQVEVQTLSPVIYTAVVYQALPADGGNFTITSISSQSF